MRLFRGVVISLRPVIGKDHGERRNRCVNRIGDDTGHRYFPETGLCRMNLVHSPSQFLQSVFPVMGSESIVVHPLER